MAENSNEVDYIYRRLDKLMKNEVAEMATTTDSFLEGIVLCLEEVVVMN